MKAAKWSVCAVGVILAAAPVMANPTFTGGAFQWNGVNLNAVAQIKLGSGQTNGGAFPVTLVSGQLSPSAYSNVLPSSNVVFYSYCLEYDQHFSSGQTYWVSIDRNAYSGGVGMAGDGVSDVSEYIYDTWRNGNPLHWSQGDVSKAIWWAEQENNGVKNAVANTAMQHFGYNTLSQLGSASHTFAMNLWSDFRQITDNCGTHWVATGDAQSQLITVPVPVPAAAILAGLGLSLVGLIKRRMA